MPETDVLEMPDGIDFNQPVLNLNDEPMKAGEEEDAEDARLGNICVNALMMSYQGDTADGVQKLKRFNLAQKIKGKDEDDFPTVQLSKKQKTLVEEMVDKVFGTLSYARVYEALEGTTEDEE